MNEVLEIYKRSADELDKAILKEAPGDHRAWLIKIVTQVRKDLQLAENMVEEGRPSHEVNKVLDRVDTVFNRVDPD